MKPDASPIDFPKVIAILAPKAIADQEWEYEKYNRAALASLNDREVPIDSRVAEIVRWLDHYKVLMGFTSEIRAKIATALLHWADAPDQSKTCDSAREIDDAHQDLIPAIRSQTDSPMARLNQQDRELFHRTRINPATETSSSTFSQ